MFRYLKEGQGIPRPFLQAIPHATVPRKAQISEESSFLLVIVRHYPDTGRNVIDDFFSINKKTVFLIALHSVKAIRQISGGHRL